MKRLFHIIFSVGICFSAFGQHCGMDGMLVYNLKILDSQFGQVNELDVFLLDSNNQKIPFLRSVTTNTYDESDIWYDVVDTVQFWQNPAADNFPCDTSKVWGECKHLPFSTNNYILIPQSFYDDREYSVHNYYILIHDKDKSANRGWFRDTILKLNKAKLMHMCSNEPIWNDSLYVNSNIHTVQLNKHLTKRDSAEWHPTWLGSDTLLRVNSFCSWYQERNDKFNIYIDNKTNDTIEIIKLVNQKSRIYKLIHYKNNMPEYTVTYKVKLTECEKRHKQHHRCDKRRIFFGLRPKWSFEQPCYPNKGDIIAKKYEVYENGKWKSLNNESFTYETYSGQGKFKKQNVKDKYIHREPNVKARFN